MKKSGLTTMEVKKINRHRVYDVIYKNKSISKQEIAYKLTMGLTTVTQNLKSLEEDGWICKTGYYESTGGRKAQSIEIVKNARTAIGVFILKNKFLLRAVNLYGEIIKKSEVRIDFDTTEEYYKNLGREVMMFANSIDSNPEHILGVGIAIQGIISPDGKSVIYGKLLAHTDSTEIKLEDIARYIPYECTLEHDSKAAGFAEVWKTKPQDAFIILTNKNLGSALVINGEVHHGKSMCSGTVEHMCVRPNGKKCYCGNSGCLDAYCAADSLMEQIKEDNFDDFFENKNNGDKENQEIWNNYLDIMSDAIININTVFDSDIIISGLLASYFTDEDILYMQKRISNSLFYSKRVINITIGNHGESAPAVGVAFPFIKRLIESI